MIIYDVNRWVPTDINMLVIAGTDDDYYYIHRSLYDQAVVLDYKYHDNIPALIYAITGSYDSREDVDYFLEQTPRPLNIFGPFLLLVKDLVEDYSDMVGAIHVMSGPVNLARMVEIDPAMRATPTYSLTIKEEYELAWNRFFQTVIPYSPDMYSGGGINPMNGTATSTINADGEVDVSQMSDDEFDDAMWELLNPSTDPFAIPEPAAEGTAAPVVEETQPVPAPTAPAPISPAQSAPEPEPANTAITDVIPERLQGLAALTGGII